MPFFRKPNIEKLKAKNNVEGLIKALRYKDPGVCDSAASALAQIGEPAVPALIEALRDENWKVRRSAASALGEIGTLEATKALEEYQQHQ